MHSNLTVVKIGSNVLVDEKGEVRSKIIAQVFALAQKKMQEGEKVLLVTSGAVAIGTRKNAGQTLDKKLAAGIGQMHLMSAYLKAAEKLNLKVSELLLARPHLVEREHFLRLQESVNNAFNHNIIPIVNENDTLVYGTDWGFPDNDTLAASLAIAFGAQKLIILSHVAGLYNSDPETDKSAKLIVEVIDVNAELLKYCTGEIGEDSRGGMLTKLKAARLCTAVGIMVQIVDGFSISAVTRALQNKKAGTIFLPRRLKKQVKNRERWLLAARSSAASIEIDEGALKALAMGKSLLAVGIKKIYGEFAAEDLVEVVDKDRVSVAIGKVDIDSQSLAAVKNKKGLQVMHADNLMVFV